MALVKKKIPRKKGFAGRCGKVSAKLSKGAKYFNKENYYAVLKMYYDTA